MHEFEFIDWIKRQLPKPHADVVLGIGDDCALLDIPHAKQLALSTDSCVEGTHFFTGTDPLAIGYKAAMCNLSDIAAMGATPSWCTLALCLPAWDQQLACGIAQGVLDALAPFGVALVGGDTTRGPLSVNLCIGGYVDSGRTLRRSAAQFADAVFVTGTLGDAGAGLLLRRLERADLSISEAIKLGMDADILPSHRSTLLARLDRPSARVAYAQRIGHLAHAAIDVSDGLLQDLTHVCRQSHVGALLDVASIPLSDALRASFSLSAARGLACTAGDDYELCFTAHPANSAELIAIGKELGVAVAQIGLIQSGSAVECWSSDKVLPVLEREGFQHF